MKNIILFVLLCFTGHLYGQNAFYEAKQFQTKADFYQNFFREVEQKKQNFLAEQDTNGLVAVDLGLFLPEYEGMRYGLDVIENTKQFINNPFDTSILVNILPTINTVIETPLALSAVRIFDFIDEQGQFYNRIEGYPILKLGDDGYQFIHILKEEERPTYCIDPETGLAIDEALKDKVIAAFDPVLGAFYKKTANGFERKASAYLNNLDWNVYADRTRKDPITTYNYKDNSIYAQHDEIVMVYQAGPDSIRVGKLGSIFLASMEEDLEEEETIEAAPKVYSVVTPPSSSYYEPRPSPSPFSPTAAIDAIAQFLVGRVKEELTMAFFDEFLEKLDNSSEMRMLFPNTYYLLQNQDIFRIPSMGEMWVNAFQDDIESLVPHVGDLIETDPKYFKYKNDVTVKSFRFAYYTVDGALKGDKFQQIISNLDEELGGLEDEVGLSIKGITMLCENLVQFQGNATTSQFISETEFRSLDKEGGKYFTAFLFQKNRDFFDALKVDGVPVSNFISENANAFAKTTEDFVELLEEVKKAEDNFGTSYRDSSKQAINLLYIHAAETILKAVDFGYTLKHFSKPEALYEDEFYLSYKPAAHSVFQATKAYQFKDQSRMLLHTMQAITPIFESLSRKVDEEIKNHKGDISSLEKKKQRLKFYKTFVREIGFYGGFMVDILAARSSGQIKGILDSYALPAGSYRIKRNSPFSIDLNAYPGIYSGFEFSRDLGNDNGGGVFGVTAPVGFALSWGQKNYGKRNRGGQSFSLFVPVIDVGAAFSYRWNNDAEGFPEEIKWEQILSPGLYAVWGFRKMPIALAVGGQYTPSLRKITIDEVDFQSNTLRVGVNLVVDIPIFNFYHKED